MIFSPGFEHCQMKFILLCQPYISFCSLINSPRTAGPYEGSVIDKGMRQRGQFDLDICLFFPGVSVYMTP